MNEPIIPLIYPKGYSVQGMDVIGRYGKRLKDGKHGHIGLYAKGQKGITASRCKIVWAARHNIDIRKIPKEYSFWLADDGTLQCDTFNARMSMVVSVKAKEIKVKREEYEFTEKYAHLALQMLDGDATAKARLFSLINGKRDELIAYARRAKGGGYHSKKPLSTPTWQYPTPTTLSCQDDTMYHRPSGASKDVFVCSSKRIGTKNNLMNTKIMANDNNKEPKVHGSGSMFVDAAIEALMQEGKDKKNFSYLLLATDGNEMYSVGDGNDRDICSAIATNMKKDSKFENFILHAVAVRMDDDPNVKTELMKIYDRVKDK